MKNLLSILALVVLMIGINGQEESRFRGTITGGYAIPSAGGGGFSWNFEPQYNLKDNMNVGIRLGGAFLAKELKTSSNNEEFKAEVSGTTSYMATYNYYFNDGSSSFAPFLGAGLGFATIAGVKVNVGSVAAETDPETAFSGMIRGGFEWKKLVLSFEYDFIPNTTYKSAILSPSGETVNVESEAKNSYFGINLGFFLGGGKWGG